ncbi:MAG: hypothetical protein BWY82_02290 [Verrucomicrobia bacterium ADurb.Bin474]|nr:MAG: hypothetical protein BWY82_02290 [Verrucomicrobia bacterium ADurb.Bin474]
MDRFTLPLSVYLTAFPTMFRIICLNALGSPLTTEGVLGSHICTNWSPLFNARISSPLISGSSDGLSSKSRVLIFNFPDSMCEISRMSLIKPKR